MQQSSFNAKPYNVNARITHVGSKTIDGSSSATGLPVSIDDTGITAVQTAGITMCPTHFSPQHFTVAYTSASTITCTPLYGMPAIDSNIMNIISIKIDRADNTSVVYINGKDGVKFSTDTPNVISIYKDGILQTPFLTAPTADTKYRVSVNYIEIGDDPSTDTKKVTVENYPVQPTSTSVAFTTDSTTSYFASSDGIEMGNYLGLSVQVASNAGTNAGSTVITIEATNVDTPDTTDDWTDITKMAVNMNTNTSGAASVTVTGASATATLLLTNLNVRAVRVKYVNTGFTGSLNLRRL